MNLPFTNDEYKDKPITRSWKLKPTQFRTRRIVAAFLLVCITVWFFFPKGARLASREFNRAGAYDEDDLHVDKKVYPVHLAASMMSAMEKVQVHPIQNVFFMLNGLTGSDTDLVYLGCEMAKSRMGATVNMIILGGGGDSGSGVVTVGEYRAMNQFEHDACPVYFHDARAKKVSEYASYASNTLDFLTGDYSPSAIFYTHSREVPKPHWFLAALARHDTTTTQIVLNHASLESLAWIAYLTPPALNAWNKPRIDLVIDVSARSGSLIRLFRSLEAAHYPNDEHPNIIINLDESTSPGSIELINRLSQSWPPNRITLRRRARTTTTGYAFLETWYPVNTDNFALLLNDQYELSPYFFHYLKAMLLQYQYNLPGRLGLWRENQFGISLQSLLAESTRVPDAMKNFKNIAESIRKTKIPVLWNHADLSGPTLFYPTHFTNFINFVRDKNVDENLQELLDTFIVERKLVLMYPPNFSQDDGNFVLSQYYADDTVPDPMTYEPDALGLQLLNDKKWWTWLGRDRIMPNWSLLQLYNAANENQAIVDFFRIDDTTS